MEKRARHYHWFVAPEDAHTNEVIAENCSDEDFSTNVRCADGVRRNLWRCTKQVRDALVANKKKLNLKFEVFCSQGAGPFIGRIRDVGFLFKKKRKKRKI